MIKIFNQFCINESNLDSRIKKYLSLYLCNLQNTYGISDGCSIEKYGLLYYLENHDDILNCAQMGLTEPFKNIPFEFVQRIHIITRSEELTLLHSCCILNNDVAVSIFFEESLPDAETRIILLDNLTEQDIIIKF